jgi:hypothetical protein
VASVLCWLEQLWSETRRLHRPDSGLGPLLRVVGLGGRFGKASFEGIVGSGFSSCGGFWTKINAPKLILCLTCHEAPKIDPNDYSLSAIKRYLKLHEIAPSCPCQHVRGEMH